MFTKFVVAGCAAALLIAAMPAQASLTVNSRVIQGTEFNSRSTQGRELQGRNAQGRVAQGLEFQSRDARGVNIFGTDLDTALVLDVIGVELPASAH